MRFTVPEPDVRNHVDEDSPRLSGSLDDMVGFGLLIDCGAFFIMIEDSICIP